MRHGLAIAMVLLWACDGGSSTPRADGSLSDARAVDARAIDAPVPVDAAVDAAPTDPAIATACMHACDAISTCFMEPIGTCYAECGADLADCTSQQVQDVDACSTEACGDQTDSPLVNCIAAVPCVEM